MQKLLLWILLLYNQLLHFNVCRYGLHYNVLLDMMMSVLQEIHTSLYFPGGSPFSIEYQVHCLHDLPVLTYIIYI